MTTRPDTPAAVTRDTTVQAGRGFVVIAASKAYFILASAVIALGLPRLFGDPGLFGEYRVVSAFGAILNMVFITGAMQSVSRMVAEAGDSRRAVLRSGIATAAAGSGLVSGLLLVFAPDVATLVFRDVTLAPYLRFSALIIFLYAIYGSVIGLYNGDRRFREQAAIDMVFSTLKVLGVLGGVALGFGVSGAIGGFVMATTVALVLASWRLALPSDAEPLVDGPKRMLRLLLPLLGTQLMLNALIQLDGIAVKALMRSPLEHAAGSDLATLAAHLGLDAVPAGAEKVLADRMAGIFGAAKNLALLPYQATFALTLVVFPLVSTAVVARDREDARRTIAGALRFTLIVGALLAASLGGASEPLLALLFGPTYRAAAPALRILLGAGVLLSVFVLVGTLLNAARREKTALAVTGLTVSLTAGLLALFLTGPRGATIDALTGAGWATLIATSTGVVMGLVLLGRSVPGGVPWPTLARVVVAAAAGVAVGSVIPLEGSTATSLVIAVTIRGGAAALTCAAALLLFREVTRADGLQLRRILRRSS